MKLKISTTLFALGLSSALIGCLNDNNQVKQEDKSVSKGISIEALTESDTSLIQKEVIITDANGKEIYKDTTDRIGAFSAKPQVEDAQFPLKIKVGNLSGEIQKSDLDTARRVALSLKKEGVKKGEFDPRFAPQDPQREVAKKCQLPKPTKEQMALIKPYLDQHQRVPDSLMPKLTAEQQSCVTANKPAPTPGQLLAEKCSLPKPDSATELQIRKYIELKQPVPSSLLPKLSAEQQACVDSSGGPINPTPRTPEVTPKPAPLPVDTGKAPAPLPEFKDVVTACKLPVLTETQQKCKDDYVAKIVADSLRVDPLKLEAACSLPKLTPEQQQCMDEWKMTHDLVNPEWKPAPAPQPLAPRPAVDSTVQK